MPGMPLARIYASIVEEAEPLRADLFARGYTVEIVVPDAEQWGQQIWSFVWNTARPRRPSPALRKVKAILPGASFLPRQRILSEA